MLAESIILDTSVMLSSTVAAASSSLQSNDGGRGADPKPGVLQVGSPTFPPPKTDKPRPHVCSTCARSFARLEHLKRHERSHTKEKPFECPECTRCFARRDLLLRHQQKLHMTAAASSRPRGGRRESTSSTTGPASGRVRKNSAANANSGGPSGHGAATMRPRANTISHVDASTIDMSNAANLSAARTAIMGPRHSYSSSLGHLPNQASFNFRDVSPAVGSYSGPHGLPRLDTQGLSGVDVGGGLRTAPPFGGFPDFDMDGLYQTGPGSTINPAQLHISDSPQSFAMGTPTSPFPSGFPGVPTSLPMMEDEDGFQWVTRLDHQLPFGDGQENAVAESSPSALSTASHSGMSEVMLDGSNQISPDDGMLWSQGPLLPSAQMMASSFSMDISAHPFADMVQPSGPIIH